MVQWYSGTELVALNTQEVMEKEVVTSLTQLQDLVSYTIDADMEEFFRYDNQREPPSLSNQGSLRSGNKSDNLEWLKAPIGRGRSAEAKAATVVVLDMAAVVHMVRPTSCLLYTSPSPRD